MTDDRIAILSEAVRNRDGLIEDLQRTIQRLPTEEEFEALRKRCDTLQDALDKASLDRDEAWFAMRSFRAEVGKADKVYMDEITELTRQRDMARKGHEGQTRNTLAFYDDCEKLKAELAECRAALSPLARIADAYDANELDDEARRFWGKGNENECTTLPDDLELYAGRGGKRLLTLGDCQRARALATRKDGE